MDGFKIPKPRRPDDRPQTWRAPAQSPPSAPPMDFQDPAVAHHQPEEPVPQTVDDHDMLPMPEPPRKHPRPRKRWWIWMLLALLTLLLIGGAAGYAWYTSQLAAVDPSSEQEVDVVITPDTSYSHAAKSLKNKGLIRSDLAMIVYGYLSGKSSSLKEGSCRVKASLSTSEIVDLLTTGCNEFKSITFFPGATIETQRYKPEHAQIDQTAMSVKNVLAKAGYSPEAVNSALSKQYSSPLFEGKPASGTLEGYIFGETYHVDTDYSVEQILEASFKEMYKGVQQYYLIAKYKQQGYTLFEGITLASIVQRELNCEDKPTEERKERCYGYQRQIAQVFYKRLKENIPLGADATFIYAADMMNVTPRVDLDSPYNTRKYPGLPPGPIGSPGIHALRAVGHPSDTDYLYYITGDDGLFYFSKTLAEHEKNIKQHCQQLCNEL